MTEATVSKKSAIIIFVLAAILVTWIDLWSKQAVHEFLEVETIETSDGKPRIVDPRKYFVVIKNFFWLEYTYNYGAFSGWFSKHTNGLAILSGIALAVIAGVFFFHVRATTRPGILFSLSLGLIWGGTCGNFYDRALLGGVRDWIRWFIVYDGRELIWPNFNIADAGICVGVSLWILREIRTLLRERRERRQGEAQSTEASSEA